MDGSLFKITASMDANAKKCLEEGSCKRIWVWRRSVMNSTNAVDDR